MLIFTTTTELAAAVVRDGDWVSTKGLTSAGDGKAANYLIDQFAVAGAKDITCANGHVAVFQGWNNINDATETSKGAIEIATQAEADAGIDTVRALTPLTATQAIAIPVKENGIFPYQADIDYPISALTVGSDTNLYQALQANGPSSTPVDPVGNPATWDVFNATTPDATELIKGKVRFATTAEAQNGTDDATAMTPLKTQQGVIIPVKERGIFPYQADIDYPIDAFTVGSDSELYQALQANGPSSTPVDPVGNPATWKSSAISVSDASTTIKGIAELATISEVQAGLDNERIVTPAGLEGKQASATVKGIVELATAAEVAAGTDTGRAVTPAGLDARVATEDQTGLIELATAAETQAGTDANKAVTSAGLASRTATTSRKGIIELATQAEAESGTDNTRAMTPLRVQQHYDDAPTLPVSRGGTGVTTSTGTGNTVRSVSPTLTGNPIAPTQTSTNDSTRIATTAFVHNNIDSHSHDTGDITTGILPIARGGTATNTSTGTGSIVLRNSPGFTGHPTAPTQATSNNSTRIATTAYVKANLGSGGATVVTTDSNANGSFRIWSDDFIEQWSSAGTPANSTQIFPTSFATSATIHTTPLGATEAAAGTSSQTLTSFKSECTQTIGWSARGY